MPIPLVIAHAGYSPYLEFTLRQAAAAVPEGGLIFLGDATNDRFPFVRHVDGTAARYRDAAGRLAATYRHMSTNGRAFELSALQRWLQIRTLMDAEGLRDAFVLDSDVLLFTTPDEIRHLWFDGSAVGLAIPAEQPPYGWCASGHSCYWPAERLDAFCDSLVRLYTEPSERARIEAKWAHHLATGTRGGVCDMTAFYLFAEREGPSRVVNVNTVRSGTTFDHNLNEAANEFPGEYAMRGGFKAVEWDAGGRPFVRAAATGEAVRFLTLHLQGHAKALVPDLYRGPAFAGQAAAALRIRVHYALRRPASRVMQPLRFALGRLRG